MPAALALLTVVIENGFEQLIQWKYGAAGLVGLLLFSVGIKARSAPVASVGAVMLAILVAGPAL